MTSTESGDSITEGALLGPMFKLAWPILVMQMLQVTYNLADTFWLGRLSADAVGAISIAFPLIFLLFAVGNGFTSAGAILVSQYTGADSDDSAGKVAGQTLSFVTIMATALALVGFFATDGMLGLLPSQAETGARVIPLAADYMEILFLGLPALFGFLVFMTVMRGHGDTKTPMRVMLVSVVLNVIIDPLFIFGWGPIPGMGIEGAALATILSRGVAGVLGLYVLFWTALGPDVRLGHLRMDLETVTEIVRLGVPTGIEQSMGALATITITGMVVTFAPPVVSAYGLGNRLVALVFMPATGLGRATNTMVGQNLGAGNAERAERAVWLAAKVGVAVMIGVAAVAVLVPEPIVGVFMATGTPEAAETIRHGAEYLRVRSVEFAFIALMQVMLGAFRGAGNTKTAMTFSLLALWVGRVPVVYYLAFVAGWGAMGIWVGITLGNVVGATAVTLWFTRGTWKEAIVGEDSDDEAPGDDVADAGADGDAEVVADDDGEVVDDEVVEASDAGVVDADSGVVEGGPVEEGTDVPTDVGDAEGVDD